MLRKIMIVAFVTVAIIVSVAPAVMKINEVRQELFHVTARVSDDKAADPKASALPDDADKNAPEGGRAGREAEAGTARNIRRADEPQRDDRSAERNVSVIESFKSQARDLAMNCGKALRGSNFFNSDVLGMLTGMVQKAVNGR